MLISRTTGACNKLAGYKYVREITSESSKIESRTSGLRSAAELQQPYNHVYLMEETCGCLVVTAEWQSSGNLSQFFSQMSLIVTVKAAVASWSVTTTNQILFSY